MCQMGGMLFFIFSFWFHMGFSDDGLLRRITNVVYNASWPYCTYSLILSVSLLDKYSRTSITPGCTCWQHQAFMLLPGYLMLLAGMHAEAYCASRFSRVCKICDLRNDRRALYCCIGRVRKGSGVNECTNLRNAWITVPSVMCSVKHTLLA